MVNEMAMECPNCGWELEGAMRFCPGCGLPLSSETAVRYPNGSPLPLSFGAPFPHYATDPIVQTPQVDEKRMTHRRDLGIAGITLMLLSSSLALLEGIYLYLDSYIYDEPILILVAVCIFAFVLSLFGSTLALKGRSVLLALVASALLIFISILSIVELGWLAVIMLFTAIWGLIFITIAWRALKRPQAGERPSGPLPVPSPYGVTPADLLGDASNRETDEKK